jgi:glycine cleavage system regulatory protein
MLASAAQEEWMKNSLVLTVSGEDRPGLVEALASAVALHGGNWERSRMTRLSGRFAGLLEVRVEPARTDALARELQRVPGLKVTVEATGVVEPPPPGRLLVLELTGQDREGIVREISRTVAARGISIDDLSTDSTSAPMSGEPLFSARAELRCPPDVDVAGLRRALGELSQDLMVDIDLGEGS